MIKHFVFFKLKHEYSVKEKKKAIEEISTVLKNLPKFIKEIQYYEIIVNQTEKAGGMDLGLISKFNSIDDLNTYRNHSKHLEAIEIIKKHKDFSTFLDYTDSESIFQK